MNSAVHSRPIQPPARAYATLRPGDRVAVVAPASPVRPQMLADGLAVVEALGLRPVVRSDIDARHRTSAGPEERRLAELSEALADTSIRGIWLARGGHGCSPLLRRLDPAPLAADPRPIIGESDATALGCFALAAGVAWVHAPMVAASLRLGAGQGFDEASLRRALFGPIEGWEPTPREARVLAPGRAVGTVWGGCLSLLAALAGTPWLPRPDPSLLVVEDTNVKPYQVHRMLVQLRDAGALAGLAGVLLGDFSDCIQHENQDHDVHDILLDFFADVAPGAPVTAGWPVGHAPAPHWSLPLGLTAELDAPAGGRPRLRYLGEAARCEAARCEAAP